MSSAKSVKQATATVKTPAKSETVKQTTTAAPIAAPAKSDAPAVVKVVKTPSKKAEKPVVQPAPTPAAPVENKEASSTSEVKAEGEQEVGSMKTFSDLINRMNDVSKTLKELSNEFRQLQKQVAKEQRQMSKGKRRRQGGSPRNPSGFAKPCPLSKELCEFLGVGNDTQMARTEVTKKITSYVKEHSLQDSANKKRILPDNKLQKLLNVPKDKQLEFFNLQTFLKPHYPKADAVKA